MNSRMIAVYLAAGSSSRMGVNKLALPLETTTLGSVLLRKAIHSNLDRILVVTKEEDPLDWVDRDLLQPTCKNKWTPVTCAKSFEGQAYSLQCGLLQALKMKAQGIMILLADQPLLSISTINHLISQFEILRQGNERVPVVAASFQGIPRPPMIFTAEAARDLLSLQGDQGARHLVRGSHFCRKALIEYDKPLEFFDVDTFREYERLRKEVFQHD